MKRGVARFMPLTNRLSLGAAPAISGESLSMFYSVERLEVAQSSFTKGLIYGLELV